MIRKSTLFLISLLMVLFTVEAQETKEEKADRMEWFKDAKLGIFVHYGIYAVNGIDESWSFFNGYISHEDYMNQLNGFTASNFDAERWAKLFKNAGAKYSVITTKHHDGVALWDSETDHYKVTKHTPAKKDLITPFVNELRKNDLKVGLYYSLIDWSYPDYPAFKRDSVRYSNNPERWARFVDFYFEQLDELSSTFNPDLYWFDGDWEHSADEWRSKQVREKLFSYNEGVIINSRLNEYGDYMTPEQGVPVAQPENPYWELCLTMNDSWGYQHNDHNYKTPYQLLRTFVDCISKGGNLLLDVGPMQDGTIPKPQIEILEEFGRWTSKHSEAIYGTREGLPEGHFNGPTALSKDHKTLYLYLDYTPESPIFVHGINGKVENVRLVGRKTKIDYQYNQEQANLAVNIPSEVCDPAITVIAVDFADQVKPGEPETNQAMEEFAKLAKNQAWNQKHLPLMGKVKPGISTQHFAGNSLLSKDENILYLLLDGKPNGPLMIKGLRNKINRIWVVGNATKLSHQILGKLYWSDVPGIAYIPVPESVLDPEATVIAVLLDGPVSLYTEEGQVIESN
ncbi:alpha-L-fucosidase [Marinilabilia salmonicolor]|uniref:alpha-L-fucosidase n=1 Tax=Marinilabilia salmonicolor TaxID=989 RepID=UPI000D06E7C7|nr:alpha-L-fucosidase [Marinilabilia salmonicolor]PRZ01612.1 alpha-L-fucosidase [Marinilabilia salmonicolor]